VKHRFVRFFKDDKLEISVIKGQNLPEYKGIDSFLELKGKDDLADGLTAKECGRGLPGIPRACVVVFLFSRYIFRVFNQTFPRISSDKLTGRASSSRGAGLEEQADDDHACSSKRYVHIFQESFETWIKNYRFVRLVSEDDRGGREG